MAYNNHPYPQVPPQSQVVINHRYQANVSITYPIASIKSYFLSYIVQCNNDIVIITHKDNDEDCLLKYLYTKVIA